MSMFAPYSWECSVLTKRFRVGDAYATICSCLPPAYPLTYSSDSAVTRSLILDSRLQSQRRWQFGHRQNVSPASKISSRLQQSFEYKPSSSASSEVFICLAPHIFNSCVAASVALEVPIAKLRKTEFVCFLPSRMAHGFATIFAISRRQNPSVPFKEQETLGHADPNSRQMLKNRPRASLEGAGAQGEYKWKNHCVKVS